MRKVVILGLFLALACAVTARVRQSYEPGDVWHYHTRPDEANSTLTILKVEEVKPIGTVVHIRVDGVRLKNCSGGPEPDTLQHMPFTKEAFERSITERIKEAGPIPSMEGYEEWKRRTGGVYNITVAEAIQVAEDTLNGGQRCR